MNCIYHMVFSLGNNTILPFPGASALDEEYVSPYFLATSKEWFFGGFSYLARHSRTDPSILHS